MSPRETLLAALSAVIVSALLTPASAHAFVGQVINGTPNPALKDAAVFLESDSGGCTGTLLVPNLIVTAAHCFFDGGVQTSAATDWRVYTPGTDTASAQPAGVHPVQLLVNPTFRSVVDTQGLDVAYLVLDGPLAAPVATRVATLDEVRKLAQRNVVLDQVGYGQTVPRTVPDAPTSPVPVGMSAPIDTFYSSDDSLSIRTNGTTGTCAGDSGSPWLTTIAGQVVLVGVLSGGNNAPCESDATGDNDLVALPSAQPDLLTQAFTAAGVAPPAAPRTCISVDGMDPVCTVGRIWTYEACWVAPKFALQQQVNANWVTVQRGKGKKSRQCGKVQPYLVRLTDTVDVGEHSFRAVVLKQRGVPRVAYDPFTVTST